MTLHEVPVTATATAMTKENGDFSSERKTEEYKSFRINYGKKIGLFKKMRKTEIEVFEVYNL